MRWCKKDATGECFPVLKSLLNRASRSERRVQIELVSGMSFIDEVIGLEGSDGQAVAVFSSERRVAVADIGFVTLAELS